MGALPNVTTPPEQPSYDYLSRLIRCQILADNGHYIPALALAKRTQTSCEEWFPKESPEKLRARERLAATVDCNVGTQWMKVLRQENFQPNADRLEAQLVQVQETVFKDLKPPIAIYTLERSVPILGAAPQWWGASAKRGEPPHRRPSYQAGCVTIAAGPQSHRFSEPDVKARVPAFQSPTAQARVLWRPRRRPLLALRARITPVAVGPPVTRRPPHGSRRAELPHRALASDQTLSRSAG